MFVKCAQRRIGRKRSAGKAGARAGKIGSHPAFPGGETGRVCGNVNGRRDDERKRRNDHHSISGQGSVAG